MAAVNLHTLDNDIIYELLTLCPDLDSLRGLILTHPALYYAFNGRRRLILRAVFKTQNNVRFLHPGDGEIAAADEFILRFEPKNPIDSVAFREALWPELERLLTAKLPSKWATSLLACYQKAELSNDALRFAKRTTGLILESSRLLYSETRTFIRAVIRMYMTAQLFPEAIELQGKVLKRLRARSPEHSPWAKQLVATYRSTGYSDRILPLQLDCWERYRKINGPGSEVALDWARSIVCEYQLNGDDQEAIKFHQRVRTLLQPQTAQYVAWSRQLIRMHQRANQHGEALLVTEEVWRHLQPGSKWYRPWTTQLSELYEAAGRPEDAIAVYLAAWTAISGRLARHPNDVVWKYQAKGAGLTLARVYRKYQRLDDASLLEAKCSGLGFVAAADVLR
jgi:hypothetical protein